MKAEVVHVTFANEGEREGIHVHILYRKLIPDV